MLWFLASVLIFIGIAAIMIFTGFLAIHMLDRNKTVSFLTLEVISLAALIGTAFWMLFSGTLSYLGLDFSIIRLALILVLILGGAFLFFKPIRYRLYLPGISKLIIGLGVVLLAGVVSLLPVLLEHTFYFASDAFSYISIADFLQTRNFITPIQVDISSPYLHHVIGYQENGFRMGANFFLALVTAWTFDLRAIDAYPAALAWGIAINLFSLCLWMRWGMRASYRVSLLAMFFFAVTPNSIQVSGLLGFFPQTFGTAAFFFGIAILARFIRASNMSIKNAVLLGVSWAFLLSAYSELFPFIGLISAVIFFFALLRSYKKKRIAPFFKTLAIVFFTWVLLSHYELYRFTIAIPVQINATVGWYIPPDLARLWSAAMSVKPVDVKSNLGFMLAGILMSILFLGGLWRIITKKQIVSLTAFGLFLAVAAYYWFTKESNMYKAIWSIYKITQWSSPLLISFAFFVLRPFKFQRALNAGIVMFCSIGIIPFVAFLNQATNALIEYAGSKTPVQAYYQLTNSVAAYQKPLAYQVSPSHIWPGILPIYFFMGHQLQGAWGNYLPTMYIPDKLPKISDTLFYCLACPFPNPHNALLPARAVVIDQPVVYEVRPQQNIREHPYKLFDSKLIFPLSKENSYCLSIFSLQAGDATLEFTARPTLTTVGNPIVDIHNEKGWHHPPLEIIKKDQKFKIPIPLVVGGDNHFCFEIDHHTSSISIVALYNTNP